MDKGMKMKTPSMTSGNTQTLGVLPGVRRVGAGDHGCHGKSGGGKGYGSKSKGGK